MWILEIEKGELVIIQVHLVQASQQFLTSGGMDTNDEGKSDW